jgi:hypothetical protein
MLSDIQCITGISRRMLMLVVGLASTFAMLGFASPAMAQLEGELAVFEQCPTGNAQLRACIYGTTSSGEFVVGNKKVPITNPIVIQGGLLENKATGVEEFVGAANGETISKSPQTLPGGLAGLIRCNEIHELLLRLTCELAFQNGLTGVTATTELAAPASHIVLNEANIFQQKGIALSLPIKVKLNNPFLGNGCYIGSNAHPIMLELTSGTTAPPPPNKPISGKHGSVTVNANDTIAFVKEDTLVNNSFAAPGAAGCGVLPLLIDPIVDLQAGLPAAAGHNTAILNNTLEESGAGLIRQAKEAPAGGSTGATGPTGEKGATGATGPSGGGTGGGGPATAVGKLASKTQESGVWSATIGVPKGGRQTQVQGVVSFPIPLKVNEEVTLNYRTEGESLGAIAPCLGSTDEPVVEAGNLCTYRGGAGLGSKETGTGPIDANAKFVRFEDFFGEVIEKTGGVGNQGDLGVDMVFRTTEFKEEGALVTSLAKEASLNAKGSWAVTAK